MRVSGSRQLRVTVLVGRGNGSPMATNVVVVVVVVVVWTCYYQIFNSLKLFHFATDRN